MEKGLNLPCFGIGKIGGEKWPRTRVLYTTIFKQDLQKHITRPIHFKWLNFKLSQEVN